MDPSTARKLRFFLRLNYPMAIAFDGDRLRGEYPDLPGCALEGQELDQLKVELEQLRQDWIVERVRAGEVPPMPNSFMDTREAE